MVSSVNESTRPSNEPGPESADAISDGGETTPPVVPGSVPPDTENETALQTALRELGPFVSGLVVLCVIAPALAGFAVIARAGDVRSRFDDMETMAPYVYGLLFAVLTGAALMPTYALSGVAGFTFGAMTGSIVAVAGVVGGAMVGYVLATVLARRRVMGAIENHPRASVIREALVDRGLWTELGVVTLLRLPPNSPFAITNLVMSSTRVNPIAFVVGTAVGMAPRTILAAIMGATIASGADEFSKENLAESGSSILGVDLRLVGIGLTLVVLIVIYVLFSRWSKAALRKRFGDAEVTD